MSWLRLSDLLVQLNVATGFNLVCVLSACYGAYFAGQLYVNRAAPCYAIIAPEDEVDPAEIIRGFRILYSEFAHSQDMGTATAKLAKEVLSNGRWFSRTADVWFYQVIYHWVIKRGDKHGLLELAGVHLPIVCKISRDDPKIKIITQDAKMVAARRLLLSFNLFFMVEKLPINVERFSKVKQRLLFEIIPLLGQ